MASAESKARMDDYDRRQRERIVAEVQAGETMDRALEKIKREMLPEYIRILTECGDLPVYGLRFPSPDYKPPGA